jgi:hypothetical protein
MTLDTQKVPHARAAAKFAAVDSRGGQSQCETSALRVERVDIIDPLTPVANER